MENTSGQESQQITGAVVAEYNDECKQEQGKAVFYQWIMNGSNHATYYDCQTGYTYTGHACLKVLEYLLVAKPEVEHESYCYRYDGNNKNLLEHADCVYIDLGPGKPENEQGCHYRSQQCRNAGHTHGIGYIALAEE